MGMPVSSVLFIASMNDCSFRFCYTNIVVYSFYSPRLGMRKVSDLDKIYIQLCIDVDTFIETVWSPSFCYVVVDFLLGWMLRVRPKIQESENQTGGLPLKDNSDEDTFEVWAWFAHFQASLSPFFVHVKERITDLSSKSLYAGMAISLQI